MYNVGAGCQYFSYWQIFAKIQPEKCDFDFYKRFFMRKMVQVCQILERKKIKSPNFYKVPTGSQEYRRILVFF
jgi:hypothetical protein